MRIMDNIVNGPQLPANLDAERAVIGSIVLDRQAIILVAASLRPDDFYIETHQWIYQAALDCYAENVPPDIITIGEKLRKAGRLDQVGGVFALAQYADGVPTAYHVEYYARIVADTSLSRLMIQAGGNIAAVGYQSDLDRAALIHKAGQLLERATQRGQISKIAFGDQVSAEWNAAAEAGHRKGVPTGLVPLDMELRGGLHRGDLILIAARTSMGKTSLALHIARQFINKEQLVLFFSLEMTRGALWDRLISAAARLAVEQVEDRASLTDEQMVRLVEADGRLCLLKEYIAIDDERGLTISDIRSRALALQAEHGRVGLVVVDYIGFIASPPGSKDTNRVQEIGAISKGLRRLAGELACPVVALAQLNRNIEHRSDRVPMLSDLRESGDLEQDADVVLLLNREEKYKPDTDKKGVVDVHIAKQRQGATGQISLFFKQEFGQWFSLDQYRSPSGY